MKRFLGIQNDLLKSSSNKIDLSSAWKKQILPIGRLAAVTIIAGLGAIGTVVAVKSIGYRLTHVVLEGGLVNGRVVRLRSPVDGKLTQVYAQPGTKVKTKEVLARVERNPQEQQSLLEGEIELKLKLNQLQSAIQSHNLQKNRLENLEKQHELFWATEVAISAEALTKSQAAVEAATAQANAERLHYDRHYGLFSEGAIPKRKIEELHSTWRSAEASVKEAEAALVSARSSLNASKNNLAMNQFRHWGESITKEIEELGKQIQEQSLLVDTLKKEVTIAQERLKRARSIMLDRQDVEIPSPITGVIYNANREQDEQVKQSEPIVSLIDCKDLWLDMVVSPRHASSIDVRQPVIVQLAGYPKKLTGTVDRIEPIGGAQEAEKASEASRVEALSPLIPSKLEGQPLKQVTVRVSIPPEYKDSHRFCGVGQSASLTFTKQLF